MTKHIIEQVASNVLSYGDDAMTNAVSPVAIDVGWVVPEQWLRFPHPCALPRVGEGEFFASALRQIVHKRQRTREREMLRLVSR